MGNPTDAYGRDRSEFPIRIELREQVGDGHLGTGVTWELADAEGPIEAGHVTGDPALREVWMAALGNAHAALEAYDRELAAANRRLDLPDDEPDPPCPDGHFDCNGWHLGAGR